MNIPCLIFILFNMKNEYFVNSTTHFSAIIDIQIPPEIYPFFNLKFTHFFLHFMHLIVQFLIVN